jgi:hypothetical protein
MRYLTETESMAWAESAGYTISSPHASAIRQMPHVSLKLPGIPRLLALCRLISACLSPRGSCLLWVVDHGVWPSSENWHLYYRLRQSYAEHQLLHEAPGHLFLDYEEPDFVSYLQLVILNGWDAELLPALTYGGAETCRGFISHDEYIVLAHRERDMVGEWRAELAKHNYEMLE